MLIEMKKFGTILNSRSAGREAFLAIRPTLPHPGKVDMITGDPKGIVLDFSNVDILTPSFADEFITQLIQIYPQRITLKNTKNITVEKTVEFLSQDWPKKSFAIQNS